MSVFEVNWNFKRDTNISEQNYLEFETKILSLLANLAKDIKTQTFLNNTNSTENQDHEHKTLVEINRKLRLDVDKKQTQCTLLKTQYDNLKKEQKLLSQEIKNTHEAFLMAKKYYKKYLKMYYTIESRNEKTQIINVQFFTECKKEPNNFSMSLLRNISTGCYEIQKTTPYLTTLKDIQNKLQESTDVPGALCYIRQSFADLHLKKK